MTTQTRRMTPPFGKTQTGVDLVNAGFMFGAKQQEEDETDPQLAIWGFSL